MESEPNCKDDPIWSRREKNGVELGETETISGSNTELEGLGLGVRKIG